MSVQYSRSQKIGQFLMIWIFPLIGAIACEIFLASDKRSSKLRDTAFTPDGGGNPPGVGQDGT
jgi:hypothetical protein